VEKAAGIQRQASTRVQRQAQTHSDRYEHGETDTAIDAKPERQIEFTHAWQMFRPRSTNNQ